MATFLIAEYEDLPLGKGNQERPFAPLVPLVSQAPITIGAASVQSAAFNQKTRYVRFSAGAVVCIAGGSNPTATVASVTRMPTDGVEYFQVNPGDKVAVIAG